MLGMFFENDGTRKEKFILLLSVLLFGLVLLAIYVVVEAVKGFNAVHEDLVTAPIRSKDEITPELPTNEEHL
ncbi:MAG: hypothetical protein NT150_14250 [Bacteroidetes bacterium]|nr:hypothetical protein [Bacteroidota bacterium]